MHYQYRDTAWNTFEWKRHQENFKNRKPSNPKAFHVFTWNQTFALSLSLFIISVLILLANHPCVKNYLITCFVQICLYILIFIWYVLQIKMSLNMESHLKLSHFFYLVRYSLLEITEVFTWYFILGNFGVKVWSCTILILLNGAVKILYFESYTLLATFI